MRSAVKHICGLEVRRANNRHSIANTYPGPTPVLLLGRRCCR